MHKNMFVKFIVATTVLSILVMKSEIIVEYMYTCIMI